MSRRRRRRRRIDPINLIGAIVVVAVVIFFISTLIRGVAANARAEQELAEFDGWYENYMREREAHEARMKGVELQKLAELEDYWK